MDGRRIWVVGHRGMVGSAIVRRLVREPVDLLTAPRATLDLTEQQEVRSWVKANRPEVVVLAAAKVGGIAANARYPVDFLYDNLTMQTNVMRAAADAGVQKFLFLGSSCVYPKFADQPIHESALLTGPLEPTNQWYAVAKIAGLKLAEAYRVQHGLDFISAMPTNLYGPGDNYDLESSHVIPALLRKAVEARDAGAETMIVWGSGTPRREFMHVDDLADALVFVLRHYSDAEHINIGSGVDVTIAELAQTVCNVVGCNATLQFDSSRPDGTPRKLMDSGKLSRLGWSSRISLRDGLVDALRHFHTADAA
ncbi:NAD-dependent epimerase/dehydratase family protein [Polymorphobacter fuscus]|uniref:GDP-L-fucose synthase n=1 Tax=Sandarakinorhabdus fusca TaxID=1439888 RepID=A0A7C9LGI7_9SPHN|nr:GDP-L-fucose synthase [Polymorphobacter fuscus]MQT17527.1 NAD-dependent epimerase/dehydratase family protein [Polymorphobacter fuscus]